jgi:hypothetical protein
MEDELSARLERLAAPPTFILGHGRSGTTWAFDAYAAHPEVAPVFETWLFTHDHGIVNVFMQPQWNPAFEQWRAETLDHRPAMVQLIDRETLVADVRELTLRWFARAIGPQHRFLVEKGPADVKVLAEVFPDARFVHMVRDGRDVALSMRAGSESWAPEFARGGQTLADFGRRWRDKVTAIAAALREVPNPSIEVRFEELGAEPRPTFRRMLEHSGIPADDAVLEEIFAATDFDVAHKGQATAFRRGGRHGGWAAQFTRKEAKAFDDVAGDLLRELGYAAGTSWWREAEGAGKMPGLLRR